MINKKNSKTEEKKVEEISLAQQLISDPISRSNFKRNNFNFKSW